jgi:hypothetical protein
MLRLVLVQALLADRREAEALVEVRRLVDTACHRQCLARLQQQQQQQEKQCSNVKHSSGTAANSSNNKRNVCCAALYYLLGRCLLRQGLRAEGLAALEKAEEQCTTAGAAVVSITSCNSVNDWIDPVWAWGQDGAKQMMIVHRASERCRAAAVTHLPSYFYLHNIVLS